MQIQWLNSCNFEGTPLILKRTNRGRFVMIKINQITLGILVLIFGSSEATLMVGGWVPYWRPKTGIGVVKQHAQLFDQMSPFGYEVQKGGIIRDSFKRHTQAWNDLAKTCRAHDMLLIPTITWRTKEEIYEVLSDTKKREAHIDAIIDLVKRNYLAGININYEKIGYRDLGGYIAFIEKVSEKLHAEGRLLHMTLEPLTADTTIRLQRYPRSQRRISPQRKLYKETIARCCDQIVLMAYDYWNIPAWNYADYYKMNYYASQAPNEWVEQVIDYALSFIPSYKLVLGIPTYGQQFSVTPREGGHPLVNKEKSIRYPQAKWLLKKHSIAPQRTPGGELSFTYTDSNGKTNYIVYMDAKAVKDKIDLAKKYNLKGIYFFAIYGKEDPAIWPLVLKECKSS